MNVEVLADAESVARAGAAFVAAEARQVVAARGRFLLALSGGRTPWDMLRALADEEVPWYQLHIVQVDERVAPDGDADRNLTHLRESFLSYTPVSCQQIYAMPVEEEDVKSAASRYAVTLEELAGSPPVLDLVHLGLGPDGHTASLVPGDPVLEVTGDAVALSDTYQGRRRMTLTYPVLNLARQIMWLVTGGSKAEMLPRLLDGDPTIPAGRVRQENAFVIADQAAAVRLMRRKALNGELIRCGTT